jgi:hypothetical protein
VPGVTANIFRLATHVPRVQDLLAVNYRVARKPSRADQQLVFTGASGVNVYRNPAALPRARVVHDAPPELERCDGAEEPVSFADMQPSRVALDATLGCRGMVVLADTAFPGWRAEVDGRPAPIHEISGALRGVVVERGSHRIEMTYRPASVTLGALMTLTGLLAACFLRFSAGNRQRVSIPSAPGSRQ